MDGTYSVPTKFGEYLLRPEPRTFMVRSGDGLLIGSVIEQSDGTWRVPTLATQTTVWGSFENVEDAVTALAGYAEEIKHLREQAQARIRKVAQEVREAATVIDNASKR